MRFRFSALRLLKLDLPAQPPPKITANALAPPTSL
jgi:hypothetical protein